tara:strand:+ start:2213 stop:3133 length:921 start_codon:yes stop_codon:yes gene_type:complete
MRFIDKIEKKIKLTEDDLTCKICYKIPKNPVIANDGYLYDKTALNEYLTHKTDSPNDPKVTLIKYNYKENFVKDILRYELELNPSLNEKIFTYSIISLLKFKEKELNENKLYNYGKINVLPILVESNYFLSHLGGKKIRKFEYIKYIIDNISNIHDCLSDGWRLYQLMLWYNPYNKLTIYIIEKLIREKADFTLKTKNYDRGNTFQIILKVAEPKLILEVLNYVLEENQIDWSHRYIEPDKDYISILLKKFIYGYRNKKIFEKIIKIILNIYINYNHYPLESYKTNNLNINKLLQNYFKKVGYVEF